MNIGIRYAEIGVCGLSCRLCPRYHTVGLSRCCGCKTESRMGVGCPFITCAVSKKGIEFCWNCREDQICEKLKNHREFSKRHDTFVCYQKLEDNISFIQKNGVDEFEKAQKNREKLLKEMLEGFNEGRSKSYYCIAAALFAIEELRKALRDSERNSKGLEIRQRSKTLHSLLDAEAKRKNYNLRLRK